MRAVIQRVKKAKVTIEGNTVGKINQGMVVLFGVKKGDTRKEVDWLLAKIIGLRIFSDDNNQMNLSLMDVGGEMLVVSQFTLYGNVQKGKRPSFFDAEDPIEAEKIYEYLLYQLEEAGVPFQTGEFGAMMDVELVNDGPVTIIVDR